jgi:hypothetical protein
MVKFVFGLNQLHILIHLIAKIHRRMIKAGLIEAVMSPLYNQDKKVVIDGIDFAARMAFDGKVVVDIVNHNSSLDTDYIRGQIDWAHCVKFVQEGIKDDDAEIQDNSWLCVESFLPRSK